MPSGAGLYFVFMSPGEGPDALSIELSVMGLKRWLRWQLWVSNAGPLRSAAEGCIGWPGRRAAFSRWQPLTGENPGRMKRAILPLLLAVLTLLRAGPALAAPQGAHVVFSSPDAVLQLSQAVTRYHGPTTPNCRNWYLINVANDSDRYVTRVLQAGQSAGTGLQLLPLSSRPEIAQVASSDDKVTVARIGAYGHRAFLVTIPPATAVALAICTANASNPPSLFAWSEPSLAQHNRNLAIFIAAVAGLIGAAALIVGGLAAMSGHAAPRWAAITLLLVLFARLAGTGLFDASLVTPLGGPYGLMALLAGLTLAAGARLTDAVVPLTDLWPDARRIFRLSLIGLVLLSAFAYVGVPAATDLTNLVVIFGTSAIAVYLVQCGRMGSLAARVLAPSAAVFALVALAGAAATLGGFGDNLIAGDAAGGFAAAGSVLLALAVAADEGLAGINLKHLPVRGSFLPPPEPEGASAQDSLNTEAILASHQGLFDLELAHNLLRLSGDAAAFAGLHGDGEVDHAKWVTLVHPDDRDTYTRALAEYRNQPGLAFRLEFRLAVSGRYRWLELRATMMGARRAAERCLGLLADVTSRKETEAVGYDRSLNDQLTGLGNRVALIETLEQQAGTLKQCAFAILDIDRFKAIHASLGDAGGDKILVQVAERLKTRFGTNAQLFRVGGDSFAILFAQRPREPAAIGDELVTGLSAAFKVDNRTVFAPASVGITAGTDAEDPLDLIRNAELALIEAKRQGGNSARVYSKDLEALASGDAVALETELRRALEENQLDIFYQPIVRLADGSLAGFEALLRWHHPKRGIVSPGDFIAHSEQTGLIVSLGLFALARATHELAHWQRFFPLTPPLFVSVNVSRRQLRDPDLETAVGEVLGKGEIQPGTLKLEITESAIATDEEANARLTRLRGLGAGLSIDDFGTGVSSLSQLRELPFDTVKIDRSFLSRHGGTHEDVEGGVILNSIVSLAHELKRNVVVEGVENARDAEWLKELGCEFAQGFFFAVPLPANEALNYIAMHFDPAAAKAPPPMAT
jgi:diguanylate cyclase (GGDEF)-like protein